MLFDATLVRVLWRNQTNRIYRETYITGDLRMGSCHYGGQEILICKLGEPRKPSGIIQSESRFPRIWGPRV